MYGDDGILATLLIAGAFGNLLSFLFPLLVIFFIVWMIKRSRTQTAMVDLQQLLKILNQSQGNILPSQRAQFNNTFLKAQNELNQLDGLRRQESELRLGDMRAEAASMGVFVN